MIPILVSSALSCVIYREVYSDFVTKVVAGHYYISPYNWILIGKGLVIHTCSNHWYVEKLLLKVVHKLSENSEVCMWESSHGVVWFHHRHIFVKYLTSLISELKNGK